MNTTKADELTRSFNERELTPVQFIHWLAGYLTMKEGNELIKQRLNQVRWKDQDQNLTDPHSY